MRRALVFLALALLSALAVTAVLHHNHPLLQAAEVHDGNLLTPIELPWSFDQPPAGRRVLVTVPPRENPPVMWRIVPDDKLRAVWVNDRFVSLDDVPEEDLGNYWLGFHIDLSKYIEPGENRLLFEFENSSGNGGLYVTPIPGVGGWAAMSLAFLPLVLGLGYLFRLRSAHILILALALVPLIAYWSGTAWFERAHDVPGSVGHIGYIQWIATKFTLPVPNGGWTYYHPPLYYMAGAAVWHWAAATSIPAPEALQAFSLALWLLFLAASAGALNTALRGRAGLAALAIAALALWPAGIIHSVRLGNDVACYAAMAVATYCLLRWWRTGLAACLWGCAVAASLGLLVKTSAIFVVAAAGLLLLWRMWRPHGRDRKRAFAQLAGFSVIVAAGMALSLADNVYYYVKDLTPGWLVSNSGWLAQDLRVPLTPVHVLGMDVPTFLERPWMRAYEDAAGRQYFWNYLLRTSLTGEFDFPGEHQRIIALMWGWLILALLLAMLVTAWRTFAGGRARSSLYRNAPWLLLTFFAVLSMLALRVQAPYSTSSDFRYVMLLLVPLVLVSVRGGWGAQGLLLVMIVSSTAFFMLPT